MGKRERGEGRGDGEAGERGREGRWGSGREGGGEMGKRERGRDRGDGEAGERGGRGDGTKRARANSLRCRVYLLLQCVHHLLIGVR
jgi:hypothetical protein